MLTICTHYVMALSLFLGAVWSYYVLIAGGSSAQYKLQNIWWFEAVTTETVVSSVFGAVWRSCCFLYSCSSYVHSALGRPSVSPNKFYSVDVARQPSGLKNTGHSMSLRVLDLQQLRIKHRNKGRGVQTLVSKPKASNNTPLKYTFFPKFSVL